MPDSIVLNEGQQEALKIAVARYNAREPHTVISGAAGTGKSTTLKFIIAALQLNPEIDVCFACPTGKAAQVLKRKGNPNAMTLHKLLYQARQDKNGKYYFVPRESIDDYKLICVDEVSMVPPNIWNQLLRHRVPVLALGDDHQLPPVSPDGDNGVLAKPHARLTEIMRQAEGNEIIDLATHIRLGKPLSTYKCAKRQVQIINKDELVTGHYEWADQILCAMNKTRIEGNNFKRQLRGFDPNKPCIGDSIISLKNHWDFVSENEEPLINGSIGKILNYEVNNIYLPRYIYEGKYQLMLADIEMEDGDIFREVPIDYQCLITGKRTLSDKQEMQLKKNKKLEMSPPFEMNYSYFATTWKAQGDEWDKVMLFEENFPFDAETHRRYLYTGITRAAEKLVVVKK